MRLARPEIEDCCVHVTHRCQGRRFLLGTNIDRSQYAKRLWQASRRFRTVRFLNYVITSNHIHFLVWSPHMGNLSEMMKWLQGTFAGDFNRRKRREGAFWRGRFHSTLVQTGSHLQRCLLYLDMNMVRAGAVSHPREWRFGGYHELVGTRKRYRIIDRKRLLQCLGPTEDEMFLRWYTATLDDLCRLPALPREPHWSTAFAVGGKEWLSRLTGNDEALDDHITPADERALADAEHGIWFLRPSRAVGSRLRRSLTADRR